jgi:hypothetical protein
MRKARLFDTNGLSGLRVRLLSDKQIARNVGHPKASYRENLPNVSKLMQFSVPVVKDEFG